MGLASMKKPDINPNLMSPEVDAFIKDAKVHHGEQLSQQEPAKPKARAKPRKKPKPVAKQVRLTFSLDAEMNQLVDRLSLIPCGYRTTRSDVVRAALTLLEAQGDEGVAEQLKHVHKA